jgi:hypothetical protein
MLDIERIFNENSKYCEQPCVGGFYAAMVDGKLILGRKKIDVMKQFQIHLSNQKTREQGAR